MLGHTVSPAYIQDVSLSTEHAFSSTAALYDLNRTRLIPGFEGLYRWAVDLVPANATQILDLGAGTGLLTALVKVRFPDVSFHLIDLSAAMLDKAKKRFAGDPQVTFEVGDYSVCTLQGRYHAVVSALSIHHLNDGAKRTLFETIRNVLLPGGVFVNAEQVLGPTPAKSLGLLSDTFIHRHGQATESTAGALLADRTRSAISLFRVLAVNLRVAGIGELK